MHSKDYLYRCNQCKKMCPFLGQSSKNIKTEKRKREGKEAYVYLIKQKRKKKIDLVKPPGGGGEHKIPKKKDLNKKQNKNKIKKNKNTPSTQT